MLSCEKDDDSDSPITGDWSKVIIDRTCTLKITSDNKFETEFIDDASTDVWGSLTISGNQITINDEGGEYMSDVPGEYTFVVAGNILTFVEVDDPEEGRRVLMEGTWTK